MKKKSIIIIGSLIFLVIAVLSYYFLTVLEIENESISVVNYKSIPVTEEDIERINSGNLEYADTNDIWKMKLPTKNYGNLFEVYFKLNYKRYNSLNDYRVYRKVDFSGLEDNEKIFFLKLNVEENYLFENQPEKTNEAYNYLVVSGITYGKSMEEIKKIIRKIKVTLVLEDKNEKIVERNISVEKTPIMEEKESEHDIESARDLLTEKQVD